MTGVRVRGLRTAIDVWSHAGYETMALGLPVGSQHDNGGRISG
jgi:hypothetical protein